MKNLKTTLFLAAALLGAFGMLSFRTIMDTATDSENTYCDSTEKSELVVLLNDSTDTDSLTLSNALLIALSDSTGTDSLAIANASAFADEDTTETKTDDEDTEALINSYMVNAYASDSTDVDSLSAV